MPHDAADGPKSLIALSMHKAGSSIASEIIGEIAAEKGYRSDLIERKVPASPLTEDELYIAYQAEMADEGVYYGVARGPYVKDMPRLFGLKTIVQVRDPRDCMTSAYYSYLRSHVPPKDPEKLRRFVARQERLARTTIDDFVVADARHYVTRMSILRTILGLHDDALLVTYEEMVDLTDDWLDRVCDFVGQPRTDALMARLAGKLDFAVAAEDETAHKRQVAPGDHKRKLAPETIAKLNEILGDELRWFGYAL
ncbi:sulfotransferase domain-containing protein [Acuticoccus sp. MNP-M23]|uniref:sulfotransferase domain-containing protein n=1 Tax=Acuticoccus sp. MNP-M23 TaxID=3072793 RepID=UPI002815A58A|nr:sulfotransferase domain-containing protein [Acuticoccus sp. MNP-M23]WMS43388.1 sulfotransferase domain-containing protein [Acuticoccus sp. MNP-M23]